MDWYQVFGGIKVISIENMVFHYPIESDDPKVIDAPNFIFDSLVRMPARWLCSNPGFQYSSAGGEGLLIQTLIPNQSQSRKFTKPRTCLWQPGLFRYNQLGAACRGNMLENLQEILCKLARKYCWETANCREGSFGFVSKGREGRGLHCSFYRPIYIGGIGIKKCGNIWRMRDPRN